MSGASDYIRSADKAMPRLGSLYGMLMGAADLAPYGHPVVAEVKRKAKAGDFLVKDDAGDEGRSSAYRIPMNGDELEELFGRTDRMMDEAEAKRGRFLAKMYEAAAEVQLYMSYLHDIARRDPKKEAIWLAEDCVCGGYTGNDEGDD